MSGNDTPRQKFLVLTCDAEALPGAAADSHIDRLLWGRFPDAPYEAGIGKMMDIAEEFGLKMVFFHDVFEIYRYGEETSRAAGQILDRGHDLQLHLHIEFLPYEFWGQRGVRPPTWAMNLFDQKAAQYVLEHGIELFEQMSGFQPIAYRAGAFRYNMCILEALHNFDIPLSFQYCPSTALKPTYPHGFDGGILPVFRWSNDVVEIPVGFYENQQPRRGLPRYKSFELQELAGGSRQARIMLEDFWNRGPEYCVYVMLLHSWSLLHRNESGHFVWRDDSRVNLFRDLLSGLPDDVRVISATDLLEELRNSSIVPSLVMPIQVAGTDRIPLAPAEQSEAPEPNR